MTIFERSHLVQTIILGIHVPFRIKSVKEKNLQILYIHSLHFSVIGSIAKSQILIINNLWNKSPQNIMTPLGISIPYKKTTLNNQGFRHSSGRPLIFSVGSPRSSTFQHLAFVQTVRKLHHLHLRDADRSVKIWLKWWIFGENYQAKIRVV